MTTKTKPETLNVEFHIVEATPKDVVCHSPITGNFMVVARAQYDKLRAAQPIIFDKRRLDKLPVLFWKTYRNDMEEARAEGMAQGTLKMLDAVGKEIESIKDEADPSFIAHMFEWIKAQTE